MPLPRFLTFGDRAYRRERMIAAYRRGMSSRAVANAFSMSDSYVRAVMRDAGVARRPGRPV
jgi:transposase